MLQRYRESSILTMTYRLHRLAKTPIAVHADECLKSRCLEDMKYFPHFTAGNCWKEKYLVYSLFFTIFAFVYRIIYRDV